MSLGVVFEAGRTFASERTVGVDTSTALAQSSHNLAFVDVSAVRRKSSLGAVAYTCWALFAGGSPSLSDGGTAVQFGAHDAGDLIDAGVVDTGEETRSLAVIAFASHSSEAVHTGASSWSDTTSSVQASGSADWLTAVGSGVSVSTLTLVIDAFASMHASNSAFLFSTFHVTSWLQLSVFAQTGVGSFAKTATASAFVAQRTKTHLSGV